jgi:hypothetical protein
MATVDEQIAAISAAIAQGARKVIFRDGGTHREVEYHSLKEMRDTLASLQAQKGQRRRVTLAAL